MLPLVSVSPPTGSVHIKTKHTINEIFFCAGSHGHMNLFQRPHASLYTHREVHYSLLELQRPVLMYGALFCLNTFHKYSTRSLLFGVVPATVLLYLDISVTAISEYHSGLGLWMASETPLGSFMGRAMSLFLLQCCKIWNNSTLPLPIFYLFLLIHFTIPHHPPSTSSNLSPLLSDNSASIVSRRLESFSQDRDQDFFSLVLVVADGGEPPLSSTVTMSLKVCVCQRNTRGRNSNVCQAQAFLFSAGLSTGAFVAILLCIVILFGK